MKKKLLSLFLTIIITISIPLSVKASYPIKLWVNGSYIESDVDPIVENERTLVPIRVISETLGYEVNWDQDAQLISVMSVSADKTKVTKAVFLTLNEPQLIEVDANQLTNLAYESLKDNFNELKAGEELAKNAKISNLDVAPKAYNNRTMVPLRAISEVFGLNVRWDGENNTVVIGDGYEAPTKSYNMIPLVSKTTSNNSNTSTNTSSNSGGDGVFHNPSDPAYLYANNRLIGHTGSKIYHAPGQKSYKKVSVENAIYFNSDSEAVTAGYRKAKR